MPIKKTPRAVIDVLDSQGNITGHEIENIYVYEPEGPDDPMAKLFSAGPRRDPATEAEVAALRKESAAGLTIANQALNRQVAELLETVAQLNKRLSEVEGALIVVQQADADYDNAVRARVAAILPKADR